MKKCTKCGLELDLSSFHVYKSGIHIGKSVSRCKSCKNNYNVEYRKSRVIIEYKKLNSKFCFRCNTEKPICDFYKSKSNKSGVASACKRCYLEYMKKNRDNLSLESLNIIKIKKKLYQKVNKLKICNRAKLYRDGNREKCSEAKRLWRIKNKHIINLKERERRNVDSFHKLKLCLSNRTRHAFRRSEKCKNKTCESLLGCTYEIAKKHIERQFKKGMTWENHGFGNNKWHIDHKIPLSSAKTEQGLINLCHYRNLQPLWQVDNLKKGKKILQVQVVLPI